MWCQSAQPFGSFSRIYAKVSSAFHRCTYRLAQKHAKKQHLYIKNYNSGPNMQTSTSLSFFTAIFVAFSDALAEELMIFCRRVRTELYIVTTKIDASVCLCAKFDQFLPVRSHFDTKRPVNSVRIATFQCANFGPLLFAFYCPLPFYKKK